MKTKEFTSRIGDCSAVPGQTDEKGAPDSKYPVTNDVCATKKGISGAAGAIRF